MNIYYLTIFFISFASAHSAIPGTYCNPSFCSNGTQSTFQKMCSADKGRLSNRCCLLNSTIIGLDWSNCNVTSFESSDNLMHLKFLMFNGKGITYCLNDTLRGFTDLEYVKVNADCGSCPGGRKAWVDTDATTTTLTCQEQRNACLDDVYGCPDGSYCAVDGPGLTQCLCNATIHGYKCLREGSFPITTFLIGWIASTVVVGISFLVNRQYYIRKGERSRMNFMNNENI